MAHTRLKPDYAFDEERVNKLRKIAPEAFEDRKINWEVLKEALGEYLDEEDVHTEHFGLNWPGKKEARKLASMPSTGALYPAVGEGIDEENTENIFIEGENLEVLRLLQKSYTGKIKMIYIDPPYNTGNDFVYDDNFTEPIEEYLRRTGQVDEKGKALTTNKRTDGRFHSKWLSMMYPRLRLARNLLREDGVIFISIDDNEVHHLKMLCNEIFGEENFVCNFAWQKRYAPPPDTKEVGFTHENILMYKNSELFNIGLLPFTDEQIKRYKNPDNDPRGDWKPENYTCRYTADERPSLYYPLINPNNKKEIWPKKTRVWAMSKETHKKNVNENRIWWGKDGTNEVPALKNFLSEIKQGIMPMSLLLHNEAGHSDLATKELRELLPNIKFTPKPTKLIYQLMRIANVKNKDLVVDFFAGSGTTAHSVTNFSLFERIKLNFICIQFPEDCSKDKTMKSEFNSISDFTKERLRKVSTVHQDEAKGKEKKSIDLGFKVFKLGRSNYSAWEEYDGTDPKEFIEYLKRMELPIRDAWTEEGLMTEVMMLEGFPLHSKITIRDDFKKNKVKEISSDFCDHSLLVCLDEKIDDKTIDAIDLNGKNIFICQDNAVDDERKLRLSDKGFIKTI